MVAKPFTVFATAILVALLALWEIFAGESHPTMGEGASAFPKTNRPKS